jgi:hypothetical protein
LLSTGAHREQGSSQGCINEGNGKVKDVARKVVGVDSVGGWLDNFLHLAVLEGKEAGTASTPNHE